MHTYRHVNASERRVLILALASRIVALALMAVADYVFADLDSSAHLQNFPCSGVDRHEYFNESSSLFDELAPWDTVYFVRIAKCGYEYDMTNAFFPLLPLLMKYAVQIPGLHSLALGLPIESLFTLIGLVINLVAFCIAALTLHRLSVAILGDKQLAATSVLLFCCNPASVFYSAAYTETLFATFLWSGLVLLRSNNYWLGVGTLTLASGARSNGILSAWFLLHPVILDIGKKKRLDSAKIIKLIASCCIVWSPYIAMQGKKERNLLIFVRKDYAFSFFLLE